MNRPRWMLRLAVVLGYVVAVAALVAVALTVDSGELAGIGFVVFGIISLGFGYAFLRYAPRPPLPPGARRSPPHAPCEAVPMVRGALFAFDRENECSVFPGVAEASGLEVNDVEDGEYVVFGEDGTLFDIWAEGLHVHLRPTDERDLAQLQERLRRFLDEWHIKCATEDVIDIANAILEAEWESRWPKRPGWLAKRLHGDAPPTL